MKFCNCTFLLLLTFIFGLQLACTHSHDHEHEDDHDKLEKAFEGDAASVIEVLKIENLLRDSLALAPDVEVVVSYLEVPVNTTLPKHYHPGEEFIYVLEGSGELYIDDQTIPLKGGDLYKVPFKAVHSFSTLDGHAKAVVFRVHEPGQPDRILVN